MSLGAALSGWMNDPAVWLAANAITGGACFMLALLAQLRWYPRLAALPASAFREAHDRHCRLLAWLAPPPMLADLAAALLPAILLVRYHGWPEVLHLPPPAGRYVSLVLGVCLGPTLVAWISTFTVQVPLHRQLERLHDPGFLRLLVWSNLVRTLAWGLKPLFAGLFLCL